MQRSKQLHDRKYVRLRHNTILANSKRCVVALAELTSGSVFYLKLAVTALQLEYPLSVRHADRKRIRRMLLAVILHPEPESSVIDTELPGRPGR
jgi:hypothetical protein